MSIDNYVDFEDFIEDKQFFIEIEAKPNKMNSLISRYNAQYGRNVKLCDDGICLLGDNVDKWGAEYRVYFNNDIKPNLGFKVHTNRAYRADQYQFRIDDKGLVEHLWSKEYQIGMN